MAKITYMRWDEVIIHEIIEEDNEKFFGDIAEGAVREHDPQRPFVPPSVNWANGIAFTIEGFPDTEEVVKDKLRGVIHYAYVAFTRIDRCDSYPVRIGNENVSVRIENRVPNPILLDLADFLKNFKPDARTSDSSARAVGVRRDVRGTLG
jgi:hypothetical protein